MMLVLVLVILVVVMVMMLVLVLVVLIVMMVMLRLVGLVLGDHGLELVLQGGVGLHRGEDLRAAELVPGGGDQRGGGVLAADQLHGLLELFLLHAAGAAEDDAVCGLDLVVVELAEVLHIHPHLGGVRHGDGGAQHGLMLGGTLHGDNDVAELAHAGGLDQNAVGMVLLDDLLQSGGKVAHQRAADAAGVHLGDLNAGVLQKAAVDADLTELVFDQNQLLAGIGLLDQLFDQRGLACAEKAGENVNFRHKKPFFCFKFSTHYYTISCQSPG